MSNAEQFKRAMMAVSEQDLAYEKECTYMSDMANWCIAHATKYMPRKNPDGTMYIPSTGMATGFEVPRSTVHTTLNHIVRAHGYGSWDNTPIIVLSPYKDIVKQNGNPAEVAGTDTYWSVNPNAGLILPETTFIIQPDNNGPLYQIGEHGATYKRDNYTDEEIETILSLMTVTEREEYDKYARGELNSWEIEHEFFMDDRVKHMYDAAKDKKAFLRGLFEESRFDILSKYLRDSVTKLVMEKMGHKYIDSINDGNNISVAIAQAAKDKNIDSNASNKGHGNSVYATLENMFSREIYVGLKILKTTNVNSVYDVLAEQKGNRFLWAVLLNLVENKPVDFKQIYQDAYVEEVDFKTGYVRRNMNEYIEELNRHKTGFYEIDKDPDARDKLIEKYQSRIDENNKLLAQMSGKKTIGDYDKNWDETINQHCAKLTNKYNAWRNRLTKEHGYEQLVQKLRKLVPFEALQSRGRDGL